MPESSIRVNSQRMLGAINKIVHVKKSGKETEFFSSKLGFSNLGNRSLFVEDK